MSILADQILKIVAIVYWGPVAIMMVAGIQCLITKFHLTSFYSTKTIGLALIEPGRRNRLLGHPG